MLNSCWWGRTPVLMKMTMLETPLGTLKSRLHRARQRLRALIPMEPFSLGERVNR